jgi:hypothetical protein
MRQAKPFACLPTALIADMNLAGGDMCPHGATEGLEVCQGHASMAEAGGFADKLLGMTRATEEAVVADDGDLSPSVARWGSIPRDRDLRRSVGRAARGLPQRVFPKFGRWIFWHAYPHAPRTATGSPA